MTTPLAIVADEESSWPDEFREALQDNLQLHIDYGSERSRVSLLPGAERMSPQPRMRSLTRQREQFLKHWEPLLRSGTLRGYHCTRLTASECSDILQNGLTPLSHALVGSRLARLVASGLLQQSEARTLLGGALFESNRVGMTCFCFTAGCVREGVGIHRFLTYWGGEAQYIHHEDGRSPLGAALRKIGTPSIVEADVPAASIETYMPLAERLTNCFVAQRGGETSCEPDFEGHVKSPVAGPQIRRIIHPSDPDFELITRHSTWPEPVI